MLKGFHGLRNFLFFLKNYPEKNEHGIKTQMAQKLISKYIYICIRLLL